MKARPIYMWLTCLLFWVCIAASCSAQTIGAHMYTMHFNNPHLQNVNTGLYVIHKGFIVGAYSNSYDRPSLYVGGVWEHGPFTLMVGGVKGYKGVCPMVCKTVTPFIIPSIRLNITQSNSLRLSIPNGQGVHVSFERNL